MVGILIWCCEVLKRNFNLVICVKFYLVSGRNLQVKWCSLIISSKKIQSNGDIVKEGVIECVIPLCPFCNLLNLLF